MKKESILQDEPTDEVMDLESLDKEASYDISSNEQSYKNKKESSSETKPSPDSIEEYINDLNKFIDESNELGDEMRKLILDSKWSTEDELNKNNLFDKLDRVGEEFSQNVSKLDPHGIAQSKAKENSDLIISNKNNENEEEKEVVTYDGDGYDNPEVQEEEPQDEEGEEEEYEYIEPLQDSLKEIINSDIPIGKKITDAIKVTVDYVKYLIQEKFDNSSDDEDTPPKGFSWSYVKSLIIKFLRAFIEYTKIGATYAKKFLIRAKDYVNERIEEYKKKQSIKSGQAKVVSDDKSNKEKIDESYVEEPQVDEEQSKESHIEDTKVDESYVEEPQVDEEQSKESYIEDTKVDESYVEEPQVDEPYVKAKRSVKERIRRIRTVRGAAEMIVINKMPIRIGVDGKYEYNPVSDYEKECFKKNPYLKKGADELQKIFNQEISIEIVKHFIRKDKNTKSGLVKNIDVIFSSSEHAYILQAKEKGKLRCIKIAENSWTSFDFRDEVEAQKRSMKELLKAGKGELEKVTRKLDYYNIGLKNMLFILKDIEVGAKGEVKILGKEPNKEQKVNIKNLFDRIDDMSVGFLKYRKYENNKIKVIDDYCYKIQK